MFLKSVDDILIHISREIDGRNEKIPFISSEIIYTKEMFRRLTERDPRLFLCINTLFVNMTMLGAWNEYTVEITYRDVHPSFVQTVENPRQVRAVLLEAVQMHRKQSHIVCPYAIHEQVLSEVRGILSLPEHLNCFVIGLIPTLFSRPSSDYVGVTVTFDYSCDYKTARTRKSLCREKIMEIASLARRFGNEDWKKAYAVVKYCVENWSYQRDNGDKLKFTSYGALVEKKAVCMGFSLALCAVFKELGIPCRYICGDKGGVGHAWNMIYVNGGWFYIDVTDAIGMNDPLYHWGVTVFDDGRTVSTVHGERLKCNCDKQYILHNF